MATPNPLAWSQSPQARPYLARIEAAERRYGLPPGLLGALLQRESQFDPNAVSPVGAQGIAQIMPKSHPGVDPFNPDASIDYGAKYLRENYDRFGDWDKALAAYNYGPGNLSSSLQSHGEQWRSQVPTETRNYVNALGPMAAPAGPMPLSGLEVPADDLPPELSGPAVLASLSGQEVPFDDLPPDIVSPIQPVPDADPWAEPRVSASRPTFFDVLGRSMQGNPLGFALKSGVDVIRQAMAPPPPEEAALPERSWGATVAGLPTRAKSTLTQQAMGYKAASLQSDIEDLLAEARAREAMGLDPDSDPELRARLEQYRNDALAIARDVGADVAALEAGTRATFLQKTVTGAAESLLTSLPTMVVGLLTRNPTLAAAAAYPGTTGQTFAEMANRPGGDPRKALLHARFQGVIEVGTELLPAVQLFKRGSPAYQRLLNFMAAELPGESIAHMAQSIDDSLSKLPGDVTAKDFLAAWQEAKAGLPQTAATTILAGGAQHGLVQAPETLANVLAPDRGPLADEAPADRIAAMLGQGPQMARGAALAPAPAGPAAPPLSPIEQQVTNQAEQLWAQAQRNPEAFAAQTAATEATIRAQAEQQAAAAQAQAAQAARTAEEEAQLATEQAGELSLTQLLAAQGRERTQQEIADQLRLQQQAEEDERLRAILEEPRAARRGAATIPPPALTGSPVPGPVGAASAPVTPAPGTAITRGPDIVSEQPQRDGSKLITYSDGSQVRITAGEPPEPITRATKIGISTAAPPAKVTPTVPTPTLAPPAAPVSTGVAAAGGAAVAPASQAAVAKPETVAAIGEEEEEPPLTPEEEAEEDRLRAEGIAEGEKRDQEFRAQWKEASKDPEFKRVSADILQPRHGGGEVLQGWQDAKAGKPITEEQARAMLPTAERGTDPMQRYLVGYAAALGLKPPPDVRSSNAHEWITKILDAVEPQTAPETGEEMWRPKQMELFGEPAPPRTAAELHQRNPQTPEADFQRAIDAGVDPTLIDKELRKFVYTTPEQQKKYLDFVIKDTQEKAAPPKAKPAAKPAGKIKPLKVTITPAQLGLPEEAKIEVWKNPKGADYGASHGATITVGDVSETRYNSSAESAIELTSHFLKEELAKRKKKAEGGAKAEPYASGMSAKGDLTTAVASPIGAGVTITELSRPAMKILVEAVAAGKHVFIDSGAFSAYRAAKKEGREPTAADFEKIMEKYADFVLKIIARVPYGQRGLISMVAPDVVGKQAESLQLLEEHAETIKKWLEDGFEVIVPIQTGNLPPSEVYDRITEILEGNDFVVGIPSNEEAMTDEQLRELLGEHKPDRIHVLGAINAPVLDKRMAIINEAYADVDQQPGVTSDATLIRAKLQELKGLTGQARQNAIAEILAQNAPGKKREKKPKKEKPAKEPQVTARGLHLTYPALSEAAIQEAFDAGVDPMRLASVLWDAAGGPDAQLNPHRDTDELQEIVDQEIVKATELEPDIGERAAGGTLADTGELAKRTGPAPIGAAPLATGQAPTDPIRLIAQRRIAQRQAAEAKKTTPPVAPKRGTQLGRSSFDTMWRDLLGIPTVGPIQPAKAQTLRRIQQKPMSEQLRIAIRRMTHFYGFQRIKIDPKLSSREAMDVLLDAYNNLYTMANEMALPRQAMGFNGKLTMYLAKSLGSRGGRGRFEWKFSRGMSASVLSLARRADSFTHEWIHALDLSLLMRYTTAGQMLGTSELSAMGTNQLLALPKEIADAFNHVMRKMFLVDDASVREIGTLTLEAVKVGEELQAAKEKLAKTEAIVLDAGVREHRAQEHLKAGRPFQAQRMRAKTKAAQAAYPAQKAEVDRLQKELNRINDRMVQLLTQKGSVYHQASAFVDRLANQKYFSLPAEMLARAGEAWMGNRIGQQAGTEFLSGSPEFYNNNSDRILRLIYPNDAEREGIFQALDLLFGALSDHQYFEGDTVAARIPSTNVFNNEMRQLAFDRPEAEPMVRAYEAEKGDLLKLVRFFGKLFTPAGRQALKEAPGKVAKVITSSDVVQAYFAADVAISALIRKYKGNPRLQALLRKFLFQIGTRPGSGLPGQGRAVQDQVDRKIRMGHAELRHIADAFDIETTNEAQQKELFEELARPTEKLRDILKKQIAFWQERYRDIEKDANKGPERAILRANITEANRRLAMRPPPVTPSTNIQKAAAAIREIQDRLYYEAHEAGIDLGYVSNYMRRVINIDALEGKEARAEFLAGATIAYASTQQTTLFRLERELAAQEAEEKKWEKVQKRLGQTPSQLAPLRKQIAETKAEMNEVRALDPEKQALDYLASLTIPDLFMPTGKTPAAKFTKKRVLDPAADLVLEKFYDQNVMQSMYNAISSSAYRTVYADTYGHDNGKLLEQRNEMLEADLDPNDLEIIDDTVRIAFGQTKSYHGVGEALTNWMLLLGHMKLLMKTAFTNVVEPFMSGVRTGDLRDGFKALAVAYLPVLKRADKREQQFVMEMLGLMLSSTHESIYVNRHGPGRENTIFRRLQVNFGQLAKLEGMTRASRFGNFRIFSAYVKFQCEQLTQGTPIQQQEAIAELNDIGVPENQRAEFAAFMATLPKGMVSRQQMMESTNYEMKELYGQVMHLIIRQGTLDPQRTERARGSMTPVGRFVFAITNYSRSFDRNVLKRIVLKVKNAPTPQRGAVHAAKFLATSSVVVAATMLVNMARAWWDDPFDEDKYKDSWAMKFVNAVDRAGYFSQLTTPLNFYTHFRHDRDPATAMSGAVIGWTGNIVAKIVKGFRPGSSDKEERAAWAGVYDLVVGMGVPGVLTAAGSTGWIAWLIATQATSRGAREAVTEWIVPVGEEEQEKREKAAEKREEEAEYADVFAEEEEAEE